MRKFLTLGAVLAVVPSMFFARAALAQNPPVDALTCDSPIAQPGVVVPGAVPVIGGATLLGNQSVCAEPYRTLVFVGDANVTNGINFAGTGTGAAGGTYNFVGPTGSGPGLCVMVAWSNAGNTSVSNCTFQVTNGSYTNPTQPNPVINPLFAAPSEGGQSGPLGATLQWDPKSQASCFNSSGVGTAQFTAAADGSTDTETWTSNYTWTNSLDNLRGGLNGTSANSGAIKDDDGNANFTFDAKVETAADTVAAANAFGTGADVYDLSDAGCLQKNVNNLTSTANTGATGLNYILVVGTATWKLQTPEIL